MTACQLSSAQRQQLPGLGINFGNALREPASCERYHTVTLYLMHPLYVHFCVRLRRHWPTGSTAQAALSEPLLNWFMHSRAREGVWGGDKG